MAKKPNVILVLTDDQGYGDLACTGNKHIKTPCLDDFYNESAHFTDFHVAPLCAPTRGGIMSGRSALRNGVWATCWGRSIMNKNDYTLANLFSDNGYATGLFGKWHLGDNYPYRPQDRGFQRVVAHKGGGVGQTPDFWGNNYFDDCYFVNGEPTKFDGYCTDVWFDCAKNFISENKQKPFFAYIATNAPHSPYLVAEKYSNKYENNPEIVEPAFYGMIENIDENFGALRKFLQKNNLEDDTIIIFMTDNGTSGGCYCDAETEHVTAGYNAGMRGKKGSNYDGGHRVPFFIRYKNGNITKGDINGLAMHLDIMPTLAELCGLSFPKVFSGDGISLGKTLLENSPIPERVAFEQLHQWTHIPPKWKNAVMTNRWRLINGTELYDIKADPSQKNDVSTKHPDVVASLRAEHEKWWAEVEPQMHKYNAITLGNKAENPTRLDAMDVLGDVAWSQNQVAAALCSAGQWAVEYAEKGDYKFTICRWPEELNNAIENGLQAAEIKTPAPYHVVSPKSINVTEVSLEVNGKIYSAKADGEKASITVHIPGSGEDFLNAKMSCSDGVIRGAYYVYVEKIN